MRRQASVAVACALALIVSASAVADERPTEAYQKAMKDLGVASQALRAEVKAIESAGAYPDYTPLEKHAIVLRAALKTTMAYWTEKKVEAAVKVTKVALEGVDELEQAARDKSYDNLVAASTAIGGTCTTCHKAHRVQTPEGTYEITY